MTIDPKEQETDKPEGLECIQCGCRHFYVDRTVRRDKVIVRYRSCRHCGKRITTRETEKLPQ